ncbi:MAG TPA: hypothetical protein VMW46_09150 [Candidatus Desulfaltia sp.]|nr:hypothetical protein [Candidatus Desulfaltia sp.]
MISKEKSRGIAAGAAAVLACLAAERIFLHGGSHDGHWWDAIPAFYALFGFAGGLFLSYGAKFLAKRFLQRKEGYYDGD